MDCGHTFCSDCWRQHCLTQIADGRSRKLLCMGIKCNATCDEDKVQHPPCAPSTSCFERDELQMYVKDLGIMCAVLLMKWVSGSTFHEPSITRDAAAAAVCSGAGDMCNAGCGDDRACAVIRNSDTGYRERGA